MRWLRHWPLLFPGFAVFILILADPEVWPVGRRGLIESLAEPEVLQHRLAAMVVVGLVSVWSMLLIGVILLFYLEPGAGA